MISIAMATYNGAKYIREQMDSLLSQTIQDFEIVICDDCSTDGTPSILKKYAALDPRIHVYNNDKNLGFKLNFEKVVSLTQGDYVALCDQDDIWFPNHIELLLRLSDCEADIICGRPVFVNEKGQKLPCKYDYLKMDYVPTNKIDVARHVILGFNSYQGASMLIKRTFFEKALPIPDGVDFHDAWFAALSAFMGGIKYVDAPTMHYRRLHDSVTISMKRKSAFRKFVGSILVNHVLTDRLSYIDAIRQRNIPISCEQKKFLDKVEIMLRRRISLCGRLCNIPYYLIHFKAIYACDGIRLFS